MVKVSTDKDLIEKFLTRGVEKIYPSKEELRKKLESGERLRIYQGFDPTGPYLHVGHAIGIRSLRILQQLGHEVIFLIGDFTAKIGDPDKETGRKLLTEEEIEENLSGWKQQASQLIDFYGENPVIFRRNNEWLSRMTLNDLIHLMSKTTVQQMIERDLFDKRLKKNDPIGLHEFLYPLMQGFDGVAMEVDMEIGGADQTFNMLMGRQLVRAYLGKEKFVRTNKMMDAPDGITMSKTKGNGINLGDTPENMFGKAMSYPDSAILTGFELLTDVDLKQIEDMKHHMEHGENPMKYKKLLAFEIVKMLKGELAAKGAQAYFENTVQHRNTEMQEMVTVRDIPQTQTTVLELLKNPQIAQEKSASDIKRLVEQGGVQIDGQTVKDFNQTITPNKDMVIKLGKRNFYKLV